MKNMLANLFAATLVAAAMLIPLPRPLPAQDLQDGRRPSLHEVRPLFANGVHHGQEYRFRNVGIIQCPNGDLLAFVEARHGVSDHNEKDVLMRRSTDLGNTWGPYEQVWGHLDEDHAGWKDPAPVVDESTGRLFYFMNTNESEKRLFYMTSDDNGHDWSDPIRIPDSLRRANWERWRNCPGPGIQLRVGEHRGRMLIPGHIVTKPKRHHSVVWYSDDHGESWQVSKAAVQGSDEVSLVELGDGRVLMNIRSHGKLHPDLNPSFRNFMFSDDGGETWDDLTTKHDLPWESGHGSMTRLETDQFSRILAFHPVVVKRKNLTCFMSSDAGKTWPFKKLIHEAGGYSSAIVLDNYDIALAHNHGHRGEHGIDFVRFNLSWLTDGKETVSSPRRARALVTDSKPAAQRIVWREDFDQTDDRSSDRSNTAWTLQGVTEDKAHVNVSNAKFRLRDTAREVVWSSEEINIPRPGRYSVALDVIKIGNFDKADYLRVYYRLGSGDEVLVAAPTFSSDPQEDFETYQIQQHGIAIPAEGQQLRIVIRARITGIDKTLYWDRVRVIAP